MNQPTNIIDIRGLLTLNVKVEKEKRYNSFLKEALRLAAHLGPKHLSPKPLDKDIGGC